MIIPLPRSARSAHEQTASSRTAVFFRDQVRRFNEKIRITTAQTFEMIRCPLVRGHLPLLDDHRTLEKPSRRDLQQLFSRGDGRKRVIRFWDDLFGKS